MLLANEYLIQDFLLSLHILFILVYSLKSLSGSFYVMADLMYKNLELYGGVEAAPWI